MSFLLLWRKMERIISFTKHFSFLRLRFSHISVHYMLKWFNSFNGSGWHGLRSHMFVYTVVHVLHHRLSVMFP